MSASSFVVPCTITLPTTTVEELVKSSTVPHIPDRYVFYPNADANASVDYLPYMDTPIIDLQLLLDDSSPLAKQELLNLHTAISTWGCFQLVNTGIASSLMDEVLRVGNEFFALPTEEKKKYSRTHDAYEGYGNDLVTEAEAISWCDRMHLRIHPADQRNYKFWPDIVPNFRETMDAYSIGLKKVIDAMLKAIAKSVNLDENIFLNQFGDDGTFFARFNFYPPCPCPEKVVGLKAHSDATLISILLQDKEVEGLQLRKDDQWYKVPVIPDALVVNIGDQLEILSNGMLKSPMHKAVTNKENQRMTLVTPITVHHAKELGPLPELVSEDNPKRYKNVDNYLVRYLESFAKGEIPLDNFKIKP